MVQSGAIEPRAKKIKLSLKLLWRSIKAVIFQQTKDKPDKFAGSKSESTFVLETIDLFEFEVVVSAKLRVAPSERIGSFQQVIAKIAIAGLDKISDFAVEIAGFILRPSDTGIFGESSVVRKTVDVTDFGDDTGRVDRTDTIDRSKGVRD